MSKTYASDVLRGSQPASLPAAAHIFVKTGWLPPGFEDRRPEDMEAVARVTPWTPGKRRKAA